MKVELGNYHIASIHEMYKSFRLEKKLGGIFSKLCKPTTSRKVVAQMLRVVNFTSKQLFLKYQRQLIIEAKLN